MVGDWWSQIEIHCEGVQEQIGPGGRERRDRAVTATTRQLRLLASRPHAATPWRAPSVHRRTLRATDECLGSSPTDA